MHYINEFVTLNLNNWPTALYSYAKICSKKLTYLFSYATKLLFSRKSIMYIFTRIYR